MNHIFVLNLTSDSLDGSFSLVAEMSGASVTIGWKEGAPSVVSNPANTILVRKVAIPAISYLIAENLQGFKLENIMLLEFVVVGGNEEIKRWLAYLCGKWNITNTFWYERATNVWASEQIKPGDNDAILTILMS